MIFLTYKIYNCMKLNKGKCEVLCLGGLNSGSSTTLWDLCVWSVTWLRRTWGTIPVDNQQSTSWQCALVAVRATWVLGCISKRWDCRLRDVFIPSYLAFTRPHVEYCGQNTVFLPLEHTYWKTGESFAEGYQDDKGLEMSLHEERLKVLGLFSLEKKILEGI